MTQGATSEQLRRAIHALSEAALRLSHNAYAHGEAIQVARLVGGLERVLAEVRRMETTLDELAQEDARVARAREANGIPTVRA